jgi:hypothetical protein
MALEYWQKKPNQVLRLTVCDGLSSRSIRTLKNATFYVTRLFKYHDTEIPVLLPGYVSLKVNSRWLGQVVFESPLIK